MSTEAKLQYKEEGLRRMTLRKEKRNNKFRSDSAKAREIGCPLYAVRSNGSWADSKSPTGYSQVCSYIGICQSPCNGDC